MSKFSDFIRNATPEEKEVVFAKVINGACERQKAALPPNAMRVAPGTDAVVWRICPEHSGEL